MVQWTLFFARLCDWINSDPSRKRVFTSEDERLLKHVLDNSNSGYVSPFRFGCFLSIFGSLSNCFTNVSLPLLSQPSNFS